MSYIGQSKRCLKTRIKEHKRDVERGDVDKTALVRHTVNFQHEIDWENVEVLAFENGYRKRIFLESYFIHSTMNTMNDNESMLFPPIYSCLI